MIDNRQEIVKYSDLSNNIKNILIHEISIFLRTVDEFDFSYTTWLEILNISTKIIQKYCNLNIEEYHFPHQEKQGDRNGRGAVWLKEEYSNNIHKVKIIDIYSLYPNKIIDFIHDGELKFSNNYLNILIPLMMDIRKYSKGKIKEDVSMNSVSLYAKYFLNYIYGMMEFPRSNMDKRDLTHEVRKSLTYIYENFKSVIYVDTDRIYFKDNISEKDYRHLISILDFHNYTYDIIEDKYLLASHRKKYILFSKDMEIEENKFRILE